MVTANQKFLIKSKNPIQIMKQSDAPEGVWSRVTATKGRAAGPDMGRHHGGHSGWL